MKTKKPPLAKTGQTESPDPSSEAPSRRTLNKRDKQNRILGAARALFQAQGYAGTTTQQIAQAAGIAIGTLFLYARNKEELLLQVFLEDIFTVIEQADQAASTRSGLSKQFDQFFAAFFDYHARDEALSHELIRELTFLRNAEQREAITRMTSALIAVIERRVAQRLSRLESGRGIDAHLIAETVFGLYYHQLQNWLGGFTSRSAAQAALGEMIRCVLPDMD